MEVSMGKDFILVIDKYMKENLKIILKCKDVREMLMVFILDSFWMVKDQVLECLGGIMDKYLKDNGKKELKMGMEFGPHLKVITMMANGLWIDSKGKEHLNIKIVHTKDLS